MKTRTPPTHVEPGEFPFPLLDGPDESRYLVWLRNHSNYMGARGFLDYVRAIGVLVRGEGVNSLIFLPWLVVLAVAVTLYNVDGWRPAFAGGVAALAVAYLALTLSRKRIWLLALALITGQAVYYGFPNARFPLTWTVLILGVVWTLLFALGTPVFRIQQFGRTMKTGSDSSVRSRDAYERSFGGFVLAIMIAAAFEVLAQSVEPFHDAVRSMGWPTVSTLVAVAVAALSASDKLLALLPKALRTIALPLIGLVGVLIPLAVVLALADFLQYRPPFGHDLFALALPPFVVPLVIVAVVLTRWSAFRGWDFGWLIGLLAAPVVLFVLLSLAQVGVDEIGGDLSEGLDAVVTLLQEPAHGAELEQIVESVLARDDSHLRELAEWDGSQDGAFGWREASDYVRDYVEDDGIRSWVDSIVSATPSTAKDLLAVSSPQPRGACLWIDLGFNALHDLECKLRDARDEVAIFASFSPTWNIQSSAEAEAVRLTALPLKAMYLVILAVLLWLVLWLTVDVNLTSIHGLYRDRLASAFLVGVDSEGDVDIEEDVNLAEIGRHEAGSIAPYHLVNVALNLQGSTDIGVRDRKSDFFIFSKRFIGGERTGYCRSESMEQVFPQMDLATAMAISAGAASPNMGRATHPALRAIMTLLNIRLGFWVPNPGRLEQYLYRRSKKKLGTEGKGFRFERVAEGEHEEQAAGQSHVFAEELQEVWRRWRNVPGASRRKLAGTGAEPATEKDAWQMPEGTRATPTVEHGLVGIAFSGGGIRSATVNLGISQALHRRGVFHHVDYMSTVSGGGYLGSSISALMRQRVKTSSELEGVAKVETEPPTVQVTGSDGTVRTYQYQPDAKLAVQDGQKVVAGQRLIVMSPSQEERTTSAGRIFGWRVRPVALLHEALGRLNETSRWVNVSDGGHIENLAAIELLRRRCKYIFVGDGEADPAHHFKGLATLIRTARIDLGIDIDLNVDALRLDKDGLSRAHWALGTVRYPLREGEEGPREEGYILYMKSSVTGDDEDEVIREYRNSSKGAFPHESTADQSFTEGQFEAYRSLGQHIGESVLEYAPTGPVPYESLEAWMADLATAAEALRAPPHRADEIPTRMTAAPQT